MIYFSRCALALLVLFGGRAAGAQMVKPAAQPLHFLVFGDWGTGEAQQKSVAEAMARTADEARATNPIQFALVTGDNFYEKGVTGTDDPQWQTKFEQIYSKDRLNFPFMAVLGNHDWQFDPLAQILYAPSHPGTRWQMDGFYYRRQFWLPGTAATATGAPLADVFFIDTDLWNYDLKRLADKQMKWLTDGLKTSTARWQIVVAHHPLYSNGAHGRDAELGQLRERLNPTLAHYGVDAYFSGHDHDLQHITRPEVPTTFIVSGARGKTRPKRYDDYPGFHSPSPGFAAVTLSPDAMEGRFLSDQNQTLHTWRITPVERKPGDLPVAAPGGAVPNKMTKDED